MNLQGYIFDLDGTLYDFGGTKFSDSRLGSEIQKRYETILKEYGDLNPKESYERMCVIEKESGVGVSLQLAQNINSTRSKVLEMIWGKLDPNIIIQNEEYSQNIIPLLAQNGKRLFLLTAAPKIWADIALTYLGLYSYFETVFGLEDFNYSKGEIFEKISSDMSIETNRIISIGDQEESDIIPAQKLGMQTLLIQRQENLLKLLTL